MKHYKIWDPAEKPMTCFYTIHSTGLLLRLVAWEPVYLTFAETRDALTLDGTECYLRFKELYNSKHPQPEKEQKELPDKERLMLEELFW